MEPTTADASRRIRVLPDQLANMIAAGEVIERPSAVLKELVENSLDAGTRHVEVDLVAGGRRLVQVADDGWGMNADDAVLCFERHATSKIGTSDDLAAIRSYGFRGEALPSIAAVSRVTLQTCRDDRGIGTEVVLHGGQLRSVKEVGRARGTTVIVRDLFFNTPARRKFLRTDATELRHSIREMTGLALGSPALGFRLAHGGRMLLECHPVRTWQERVQSLFGREIFLRSIELDESGRSVRLYGVLGRPGDAGGGYTEQYLLVNARSVQSRLLRKAVFDGYEATLEGGKQPSFILFLEVEPSAVDVNVHPQKREVRFHDEREAYQFVRDAIRRSFAEVGAFEPRVAVDSLPLREDRPGEAPRTGVARFWSKPVRKDAAIGKPVERVAEGEHAYAVERPHERQLPEPSDDTSAGTTPPPANDSHERFPVAEPVRRSKHDDAEAQLALNLMMREVQSDTAKSGDDLAGAKSHLWQFQQKYVFVSTRDGLWIIDQHVAHERILYEGAMAAFSGETPASQHLLFPLAIELSPEQDAILDEVQPILESMGFGIQRLSGRSIVADAYPSSVRRGDDGRLIREMIEDIAGVGFKRTGLKEQIAASYACHAAIKAGEPLSTQEMRWLIEQLFTTSMPYVCPHGRPIVVKIDMAEFDERFGRT